MTSGDCSLVLVDWVVHTIVPLPFLVILYLWMRWSSQIIFLCGYHCEFWHCLVQDKKLFWETESVIIIVLIINAIWCTWFGPTLGMLYLPVEIAIQSIGLTLLYFFPWAITYYTFWLCLGSITQVFTVLSKLLIHVDVNFIHCIVQFIRELTFSVKDHEQSPCIGSETGLYVVTEVEDHYLHFWKILVILLQNSLFVKPADSCNGIKLIFRICDTTA
jgi:hypothetical protein